MKKTEVVFNISSGWVKVRLHIENEPPVLPITALIVMGPGVVVVVVVVWFFLPIIEPPNKSCFKLF